MVQTEQDAISTALSLPCWAAPRDARPLGGGMTNHNVMLTDQGRKYVVRIGADRIEHGIMRFNEVAVSRAAAAAGIAPAVHYAEPGILVLEYLDAQPLSAEDLADPQVLSATVDLVKRVHRDVTAALSGPVLSFWVFHIIRDYARTLTERGSRHQSLVEDFLAQAARMEAAVGPVTLVLGHNDLLPANILRGDGRYWLIDWEYAGFNSPLFDLGGLATNNGFRRDQEAEMLAAYFGRPPDDDLWRRYDAMKCASLLRETMWSMVSEITSEIEFDYGQYTAENLAKYQRALAAL
jgi:thiamine kinase-like enzyme